MGVLHVRDSRSLLFPAHVGFRFVPKPCDCDLNVPLALFSLANYKHIVMFWILFLLTSAQVRAQPMRVRLLIASGAVLGMAVYVELAEAITGEGHCRLRDGVPDAAGALLGAVLLSVAPRFRCWLLNKPEVAS